MLFRVINGPSHRSKSRPFIPQQRTCESCAGMSVWCHLRTHAPQQITNAVARLILFNHLVGTTEQRQGHRDAERLRGLEIEHQLVTGEQS